MKPDISRHRFNPTNDYSGILNQQGRVLLDSDFNELIEMLDRRTRAQAIDTFGPAAYPAQTPSAFLVQIDSLWNVTIGCGRMYVDGLVAENHGRDLTGFDPTLAEASPQTSFINYLNQPFYPAAPSPNVLQNTLAYLDVWQREVTFLQNPDLVEKAVGVDSTARVQTVWQVRFSQATGADDPVRVPSGGRLTSRAVQPLSGSDSPCIIPPRAGYRGVDNRLYRIEIHAGGQPEHATFKWSRDNASMSSAVLSIDDSGQFLIAARVQMDSVLCFNPNDWVEIIDDIREFTPDPVTGGRPPSSGQLLQILDVDPSTNKITFKNGMSISDDLIPQKAGQTCADAQRNTRMRRWDQSGIVRDSDGNHFADLDSSNTGTILVPASGTFIELEDGVQIAFDTDGSGSFRAGDYWVFTARAIDGTVEALNLAAPLGVHHHFCCLANLSARGVPADCRIGWQVQSADGCCDCTFCVPPNQADELQSAIDKVAAVGGTVCLTAGVYNLPNPIRITTGTNSLTLRGQGSSTILKWEVTRDAATQQLQACITIEESQGVTMQDLSIIAPSPMLPTTDNPQPVPAVCIMNAYDVTIQRCQIQQLDTRQELPMGLAIGLAGAIYHVDVRENIFNADYGMANIAGNGSQTPAAAATPAPAMVKRSSAKAAADAIATPVRSASLFAGDLSIEKNRFFCTRFGIKLGSVAVPSDASSEQPAELVLHTGSTRIADNFFQQCSVAGIWLTGTVAPQDVPSSNASYASTASQPLASHIDILGNTLCVSNDGIIAGTDQTRIGGNDITPMSRGAGRHGIGLSNGPVTGIARSQIFDNRITGMQGFGIHIDTPVQSTSMRHNMIQGVTGGGIVVYEAIQVSDAQQSSQFQYVYESQQQYLNLPSYFPSQPPSKIGLLCIESNQISDISGSGANFAWGIRVANAEQISIQNNTITRLANGAANPAVAISIHSTPKSTINITGNRATDFGSSSTQALGIDIKGVFLAADVTNNTVLINSGSSTAGNGLRIGLGGPPPQNESFLKGAVPVPGIYSTLAVRGNLLNVGGVVESPCVSIVIPGTCTFAENRCFGEPNPIVNIFALSIIATSNYCSPVTGHPFASTVTSMELLAPTGLVTIVGNIVVAPIQAPAAPAVPITPYNQPML